MNASKIKNKYYTHNTYDDGTENFTIDLGTIRDEDIDVDITEAKERAYIYTPDQTSDLRVSLPDTFDYEDYNFTINNGVITITWDTIEQKSEED